MTTEVTESGGPEDRVGQGVGHRIGVTVPGEAADPVTGDDHTAQHQRPPGVIAEPVHVESLSDPQERHRASSVIRTPACPTSASARARSSDRVSFTLCGSPITVRTVAPSSSTSPASSVASPPPAWAARRVAATKAWGVCTATSPSRSTVEDTRPSATRFRVSDTATTGMAPSTPGDRTASTTAAKSEGVASGRAASWTTMMPASSGTAASPARTDAARVAPPGTTRSAPSATSPVDPDGSERRRRTVPGTTSTTPSATDRAAVTDQAATGRPASCRNCLGPPNR